jgi:hypothetical protein
LVFATGFSGSKPLTFSKIPLMDNPALPDYKKISKILKATM